MLKLHVSASLTPQKCQELAQEARVAIYEGLGLKDHYGHVIISQAPDHCRAAHPERSPDFVVAELFMFQGRDRATKERLIGRLYQAIESSTGVSGRDVFIRLSDSPRQDWGIWGGRPADQVDLDH